VEPNSYLYNKVFRRLNQPSEIITKRYKLTWVAAFILLISLNLSALAIYKSNTHKQKEKAAIEALSNEMISNNTYNY